MVRLFLVVRIRLAAPASAEMVAVGTCLEVGNLGEWSLDLLSSNNSGGLERFSLSNRSASIVPVPWLQLSNLLAGGGFRDGQRIDSRWAHVRVALAHHALGDKGRATLLRLLDMNKG